MTIDEAMAVLNARQEGSKWPQITSDSPFFVYFIGSETAEIDSDLGVQQLQALIVVIETYKEKT